MPTYFQKPENAQNRANEFIKVGNKESALEVLNDIIRSKKHRQWSKAHEENMMLFMELCVDLQRSAFAKDGLYQYRNICKEATTLSSFKAVVEKFLSLAAQKAKSAKEKSEQTVLQDVEDLDYVQTPESLLLSTVSGEGAKERTDRVLLTPWVKFLWESYRNILELLKNNTLVKNIYVEVAKGAFAFCLEYQRRTEFRKLCDILKNHLGQAHRYKDQPQQHSLRFEDADTIQCLVDIRFEQLECSITIDLWQEAFKAIEEIHNLLSISGKSPRPGMLENFYTKQGRVYWMANNKLFHAAALHKLFVLRKDQKRTLSQEEAQNTACQVVLATLCVPIESTISDSDRFLMVDDLNRINARRLSELLRMAIIPTRASLLKDLSRYNVMQFVPAELHQLYQYLEEEFSPLLLCKKVEPILEKLAGDKLLAQYVKPLKDILVVRLVKQVSQVYQAIELSRLAELVPFTSPTDLERIVVEMACSSNIQVQIDHRTKSLRFGMDVTFASKNEPPEGPFVQALPSELLCNQLTMMSHALQHAVKIIAGEAEAQRATECRMAAVQEYLQYQRHDHRSALQRKVLIEARKEYIEKVNKEKEAEEYKERIEKEKKEREAEEVRLKKEAEERTKAQNEKKLEELKKQLTLEKLNNLKQTPLGAKALEGVAAEDYDNLDADELLSKQMLQLEKERKDKESKQKVQEKKIDYFERAKRMEEIPLLKKQYEEQIVKDEQYHEQQEEEKIVQAIKERKEGELIHKRMKCMLADRDKFLKELKERRHEVYLQNLEEFKARLATARAEKLEQRKNERKEKRKIEAREAKKAEEERLARLKREEERRIKEQEDKARLEYLEQQRLKQLQREKEIEEKLRRQEEEIKKEISEVRPEQERMREKRKPQLVDYPGDSEDWRAKDNVEESPPKENALQQEDGRRQKPKDDDQPKYRPAFMRERMAREESRADRSKDVWREKTDEHPRGERDDWRGRPGRDADRPRADVWREKPGRDEDRPRDDSWRERPGKDEDRPRGDGWRERLGRDEDRPRAGESWRERPARDEDRPRAGESWRERPARDEDRPRGGDGWRERPGIRDEDRPRGGDSWRGRDEDRSKGDGWRERPGREDDRSRRDDRPRRDEDRPRGDREVWKRRDDHPRDKDGGREKGGRDEDTWEREGWRRGPKDDHPSRERDDRRGTRAPQDSWRQREEQGSEPKKHISQKPEDTGQDGDEGGWSVVKSGKR